MNPIAIFPVPLLGLTHGHVSVSIAGCGSNAVPGNADAFEGSRNVATVCLTR
jgi:hypothetical protein